MSKHHDDSQMSRFESHHQRSYTAWDAVRAVAIVALLLVLLSGGSIGDATAEMSEGIGRDVIAAVGEPAGWVADRLPLDEAQSQLTGGLSPDADLGEGGFDAAAQASGGGEVPTVTPTAFDPAEIGAEPAPKRELETLLVTGDSLSTPLDTELARRLAPDGVEVIRDPHLATGISNSDLVDWGELSTAQVAEHSPDAVVVFIGANEGFPLPGPNGEVACCGADYAAAYANRVRQVMNTYRRGGEARVYWLTVMTPRDADAQRVARVVNAAVEVAAQPWRSEVRVLDTVPIFTPGGEYADAIAVDGSQTIVRESDGVHLNAAGSAIAADEVIARLEQDFVR